MRLIDAEAPKIPSYFDDPATAAFLDGLQHQPTIDAVPVVRCRECKHLLQDLSARAYHICMRYRLPQRVNLNDFCSRGEREGDRDYD